MAPHQPHLRRMALIAVAVLAWTTLGITFATSAQAADGLVLSGNGRFVVDPAGSVAVTVTATMTNQKPDSDSGYYYWNSFTYPVPTSADNVRVTSRGSALATHTGASPNAGERLVIVDFPNLRYGQSRTLELTYVLNQAMFRTDDTARVGEGFATFPVVVPGDPGEITVEVVAPTRMTFSSSEANAFTETTSGDNTIRTAKSANQDGYFVAMIAFMADDAGERRTVEVDGRSVTIIAFPSDPQWADFVSTNLPQAMASLAELTGQAGRKNLLEIREDVNLHTQGWDGAFDPSARTIRLSEDLALYTFCHELAHTWLDWSGSTEHWLSEGLAADLGARTVKAITGAAPTPEPYRPVTRTDAAAIPLDSWPRTLNAKPVEGYAYPASMAAVDEMLNGLDPDQYARVVGAVATRALPLGTSGIYEANQVGWRQFLDLVESSDPTLTPDSNGRTAATDTIATWVLTDPASVDWKARAAARSRYRSIDTADGPWVPPQLLRDEVGSWDYPAAQSLMQQLEPLAATAADVQRIATETGRSTAGVQAAYEKARRDDDVAALSQTLTQASSALTTLKEADRASADTPLPTAQWARDVLSVPDETASAEVALREGRADAAASLARVALDHAKLVGVVAAAAIALPALLLLGIGFSVRALRRRHRARAAAAASRALPPPDEPPASQEPPPAGPGAH